MPKEQKGAGVASRAALKATTHTDRLAGPTDAQRDSARAIGIHVGDGLRHAREACAQVLHWGRTRKARRAIDAAIAALEIAAWVDDVAEAE